MQDRTTHQAGFDFGGTQALNTVFLAIKPEANMADAATSQAERLKSLHGLRGHPMPASRLHVTLHKLGDFADDLPPGLVARACEAAGKIAVPAFDLFFDEVMNLGSPQDPVVVLCGGNSDLALAPLLAALSTSFARVGVKIPSKLAVPHMTLIYGSSPVARQRVDPIGWRASELVLVHSLVGRGQHIQLGQWPLGV